MCEAVLPASLRIIHVLLLIAAGCLGRLWYCTATRVKNSINEMQLLIYTESTMQELPERFTVDSYNLLVPILCDMCNILMSSMSLYRMSTSGRGKASLTFNSMVHCSGGCSRTRNGDLLGSSGRVSLRQQAHQRLLHCWDAPPPLLGVIPPAIRRYGTIEFICIETAVLYATAVLKCLTMFSSV